MQLENLTGRDEMEGERILQKWLGRLCTELTGSGYGPMADFCDKGYEPP
jgi:hypothetical protein